MAGDAAHVDDGARACPSARTGPWRQGRRIDLVVGQVVGALGGDERVDRDDRDPGRDGLVDRRVERVRIVRVDDDRVDVGRDQVADVGQLTGRVRVVVDDGDLVDLAGRDRLGLDRADRGLAPAVADAAAVGEADVVWARRRPAGAATRRNSSRPRRRSPRLPDRRASWLGSIPSDHAYSSSSTGTPSWSCRESNVTSPPAYGGNVRIMRSASPPVAYPPSPRPLPRSRARARRRECSR